MRILIAPNAFKGSLGADEVAQSLAEGLRVSPLQCEPICHPVGDGGDGTASLLTAHLKGQTLAVETMDPLGRPVTGRVGLANHGDTAIIDVSEASGLRLLRDEERAPLNATTLGTGKLIAEALDRGARHILLGLGGSATIDGGAGILQALGVRFLDHRGRELSAAPKDLADLATIDTTVLHPQLAHCRITALCDVTNPLLGDAGAAAAYGPQKGASATDVAVLTHGLRCLATALEDHSKMEVGSMPRGGAAGGIAASLHALFGAELVDGAGYFLDCTDFDAALSQADLVITGEGAIDDQTLSGKAPYVVARRAREHSLPVIAIAGRVPIEPSSELRASFDALLPIGEAPASYDQAILNTRGNLFRTGREIGSLLAI